MLTEWHDHLRLIDTPAYEPGANRIEWLWRWARREVTYNHHRETFRALVQDIQVYCQALAQQPRLVLRHRGSPLVDQMPEEHPQAWAA